MTYAEWIADYERRELAAVRLIGADDCTLEERLVFAVRGRCATASAAMVAVFPELRRVRGHYNGVPHWWCVAPDGTIVDPTARQFVPGGTYVEYHGPDPLGKCMNCGALVWTPLPGGDTSACSDECLQDLMEDFS